MRVAKLIVMMGGGFYQIIRSRVARIPTSEKLLEIDFEDGKVVRAGRR
jgi:hypothetical protein